MKKVIHSFKEFEAYVGKEIGPSNYLTITQNQINLFADATLDHQWIHVDTEKAAQESTYQGTIAHGYLTLSLLPFLWAEIVEVKNIKMMVNYGVEKLRFKQAVMAGAEVRLMVKLVSLVNLRGTAKAVIQFSLEMKGSTKNAIEGTIIFLYHFN
ncbi:acyl dehydratase [Pedobacter sp. KBW06]|uniref:MaoC family dehydratase n=1 Tax=Pedobacter sp. KBW06 TaxID=2153359 RepID=UPI000F593C31|nr:MaoC family dehydratase [Pedobacter sp. KBW06]RQO65911.1 acyl dehydratase [Pedobacter sp. KBW06]